MVRHTSSSLDEPAEANRISKWFEENDKEAYVDMIGQLAQEINADGDNEETKDSVSMRFMEWVDSRHDNWRGLLGTEGGYFNRVYGFVKLAIERNKMSIETDTGLSIPVGFYEQEHARLSMEDMEEAKSKLVPNKGTVRKWEPVEINFLQEKIVEGISIKSAWEKYLKWRLDSGKVVGRRYTSFQRKHYNIRKKSEVVSKVVSKGEGIEG